MLSYQPSESSQVMMTAVDFQVGSDSSWLMVAASQVCSSSGSELFAVAVLVPRAP